MNTGHSQRAVIMIPTYNERENIRELVEEILRLPVDHDLQVLVADDNSPDGTGLIVEEMAERDPRVHVLIRKKRRGRGAAGIDGFKRALELAADLVVEMDGDFSHQPRFIPGLLAAAADHDLVLGSRFVAGGKDADRNFIRKFVTICVRAFIRSRFHIPVRDVSSGFRCFRREVLERIDLDDLISVGPSIVLEILYKTFLLGYKIIEIPIEFIDRRKGRTKLTLLTLVETLVMALKFKKMYIASGLKAIK